MNAAKVAHRPFRRLARSLQNGKVRRGRGLTRAAASLASAAVLRLRLILALFLCALWLPATLHCDLGAAGFAEAVFDHEDHPGTADASPHGDACDVVESGWVKRASADLTVAAPADCPCLLGCLALLGATAATAAPVLAPTLHTVPPELAVTWQFVARAAPPARAPASLNV